MRRILFALVFSIGVFGLCADMGQAQGFRSGALHRPAAPVQSFNRGFFSPFNTGFSSAFNNGFITSPRLQVNASSGTFNPSTGAFIPGLAGPVTITRRGGFEPVGGTFTPTPQGDFVLRSTSNFHNRERGNFTPFSGSFVNSTTGSFNPFTGGFVPGGTGNFTLASNGAFVPTNGLFVPSANGNFVLAAKAAFNPLTGTFVPARNGTFNAEFQGNFIPTGRGSFTTAPFGQSPSSALNAATLNNSLLNNSLSPFGFVNTRGNPNNALNAAVLNTSLLNNSLSPFGSVNSFGNFNPFLTSAFNPNVFGNSFSNPYANPFGFASPYYNPYANPYVGQAVNPYSPTYAPPAYSYASYGGGGYAASYAQPSYAAPAQNNVSTIPAYTPNNGQARQQPVLAAYGIPNEDGAVRWPLAFRLMSPEKKQELLDPLDGALKVAANQAAQGNASPSLIRQAKENLDNLNRWLQSRRLSLAEGSYRDADNFLRQIDGALKTMRAAN